MGAYETAVIEIARVVLPDGYVAVPVSEIEKMIRSCNGKSTPKILVDWLVSFVPAEVTS
jgi:hypothetical protein